MYSFFGLASATASEGYPVRAARLWGISEAMREAAGIQIMPSTYTVTSYESRLAEARARLGEAAFEEAWAEGKARASNRPSSTLSPKRDTDQPTTFVPEESLAGAQRAALSPPRAEVALLAAQEPNQSTDLLQAPDLRAHRRQSCCQDSPEIGTQFASPDRHLGG